MKIYDSYKDSGVEWIGEIPSHWMTTKIKYTAKANRESFVDGDWIESNDLSDEGIRYITTGNIGQGKYKEQGRGYISEETFIKLDCTEVLEGDLVISRLSLPVGRSCILPKIHHKVVTSVDNVILRPKEDIDKYFLNYLFNSARYFEHTELISRGVTLTRISRGMLGNNPIVIPPLAEQQQIVSFLDEKTLLIDSLIEKTHCKIDSLKEKRISLINEVVTKGLNPNIEMKDSGVEWIGEIPCQWELKQLKHISEFQNGYGFKSDKWVDSGIPIIRIQNLNGGEHFNFYEAKIGLEKYLVSEGDLLFSWSGNVGTSFGPFMWNKRGRHYLNQHIFLLNQKVDVNLKWYFYTLNRLTRFIEEYYTSGVIGLVHITKDELGGSKIPYPPISEQQQIVEYLDKQTQKIDKTIVVEKERVDLLKEYRKSLISSVVTGKIKVTEDA
jgi:type I restriction enzyme S subunit